MPTRALAFESILKDRALTLEDRTAVALMFLPSPQLKAFLTSEEELYADKGVLDGVLLTGMAHRGLHLMQRYLNRTMDIQTAALVATRSVSFFPPTWRKEKETVHVWATGYRQRLMEWQFWFNAGLFAKYCQRAKASFTKEPLSAEAEARLEVIRDRNTPRPQHATLPTAPAPRALASVVPAASSTSATTPPPSGLASKIEAPTTATFMPTASASAKPASRGTAAAASGVVTDTEAASAAAAAAATASSSSGKPGGVAGGGGGGSGDVGGPPDTTMEAWYGFGGSPLERNFLRVKCNFCQTPVGDLPKAKSGAAGSGGRQGGRPGEWDSPRPTSINAPPPPPLISYCSSCRNPLPRCFICLQQIGTLNPETEARRRQFSQLKAGAAGARTSYRGGIGVGSGGHEAPGGGGGAAAALGQQGAPQAALDIWWSWCNVCNHGGHNGHLEDWFAEHDTCGVRGCDCKCTSHDLPIVSKIA
ncbi:unnamed protein product [Ectocarpus sp. CCAP 1310/34]|nr:unnamed protein product [Ectocarpus sp. CCAP 1310/34]